MGFDCRSEEKRNSTFEGHTQGLIHTRNQGRSSGRISAWAWVRPTCWYWRVSSKVVVGGGHSCGSLWGQRHWLQEFQGIFSVTSTPGSHHFLTKTRLLPAAYELQCWDTSGQTSNQGRNIADRLLKVLMSSQLPTKHTPWHGPAYQRDKTQLHSPGGRNQSCPAASLYKSLKHASTMGQRAETRRTTTLQPEEWKLQSQKVEWQRKMSQMKENDKTPEEQLREVEIGNLSEKEFRIMVVKMIQNLGGTMEAQIQRE